MKSRTILVRGRSVFPWDMLRYDQAAPADVEASAALQRIAENGGRVPKNLNLLDNPIRLICYGAPTPARWASFLWSCEEVNYG